MKNIANCIYEKIFDKDYVAINNLSHIVPEFMKVGALRKLCDAKLQAIIDIEHVTLFLMEKK